MSEIAARETQRLFVGVPVPEKTGVSITRQLPASLPGRQPPLTNWHFTLRFLGDAEADRRDRVIEKLRAVGLGTGFSISFEKLGAFPNARRAKVLWLGVSSGRERLEALAAKVETAVRLSGFEPETRRFSPHLTLSRLRAPESVADLVSKSRAVNAEMLVDRVILYSSVTGGPHSLYTIVQTFPLS